MAEQSPSPQSSNNPVPSPHPQGQLMSISWSISAAIRNSHRLGGLDNRTLSPHSSGGWGGPQIRAPVDPESVLSIYFLVCRWPSSFCPHLMGRRGGGGMSGERGHTHTGSHTSSYKATNHIHGSPIFLTESFASIPSPRALGFNICIWGGHTHSGHNSWPPILSRRQE